MIVGEGAVSDTLANRPIGEVGQRLPGERSWGGAQAGGQYPPMLFGELRQQAGPGGVRDPGESDPPLGEGAGLVEAEYVDAAEGLDGVGVAYQGTLAGQPLGSGELRGADQERQPLRDAGDGEPDASAHRVLDASARSSPAAITAAPEPSAMAAWCA